MAFNGTEGEFIDMEEAADMTSGWRNGDNGDKKGGFLGREKLEQLLAQTDAQGIRIYFGVDPADGKKTLVLVAADSEENDITDLILDRSAGCPRNCGVGNDLNGNI
ncbi:MAG: hypothetical protein HRT57_03005 [Crocinitomicaceae bacterium]|nr:hypothetical protein [Crocinitomicaceae bacterium]